MKKIITHTVVLVLITVATYVVMAYIINQVKLGDRRVALWMIPYLQRKGGQEEQMMLDYDSSSRYDVVVFGSSHAYRGYDPREFSSMGYILFNAGSSSQHTIASKVLYEKFIRPQSQSLFIIDIYDKVFEGEGMECTTRLIENSTSDQVVFQLMMEQPDLRVFNAFTARTLSRSSPDESKLKGYVKNGYCSNPDTLRQLPDSTDSLFVAEKSFFEALDDLLSEMEKDCVRYILVSHPQPEIPGMKEYHRAFCLELKKVTDGHKAIYVDMTHDVRFDRQTGFADKNHMNQSGVNLFNRILIDSLVQLNYLPHH